jgi:hypothetical protein
MADESQEKPLDVRAKKANLNYIASTATSAASSTAPAWPWRPWTSSSSTAASPPTSSTSAARHRRGRRRGLPHHPLRPEGQRHPRQHLRRYRQVRPDRRSPGPGRRRNRLQGTRRCKARRHQLEKAREILKGAQSKIAHDRPRHAT